MPALGPWLRATRIRRDTTEAELARALGTEQSEIAMIERGEHEPSSELRSKLEWWIRSGAKPAGTSKRGPYAK